MCVRVCVPADGSWRFKGGGQYYVYYCTEAEFMYVQFH
jgi:hypothetical protein